MEHLQNLIIPKQLYRQIIHVHVHPLIPLFLFLFGIGLLILVEQAL